MMALCDYRKAFLQMPWFLKTVVYQIKYNISNLSIIRYLNIHCPLITPYFKQEESFDQIEESKDCSHATAHDDVLTIPKDESCEDHMSTLYFVDQLKRDDVSFNRCPLRLSMPIIFSLYFLICFL